MGLLGRDPSVAYRGGLLPYLQRTVTDPGDDITEYEQLEWALPGLLYEPLSGMAKTGGMLAGDVPVDPRTMTMAMVDAPLVGGLLAGATGMVPKGAVLGANVGGKITPGIRAAYARQGRMQPEEAPIGAKGQELLVPVPYSKTLKIPKAELDAMEGGLLRSEAPNMGKRKVIDLAAIEGEKIFPLVGDRTSREVISTVGGQKLDQPITTQGGFGYSMADDTGGWASKQGVTSRLRNKIDEEGGGVGIAMPMAGTGSDYSMHSIDVLFGLNLPAQMTNRAQQVIKKLVNDRIKTKNAGVKPENKIEKFPGLNDPDSYDYFLRNPDARKFLMESLDNKDIRNIPSMPDIVLLRQAVTDASLKDMRRGDIDALAGQSLVRFAPGTQTQPSALLPSPHKSYESDLPGKYLGGLLHAVPRSLLMPDYVSKKLAEGYAPHRIDYMMPRHLPFQKITPKIVDTVGKYTEDLIRRGGK